MKELLRQFNQFFKGAARAQIKGKRLEITIGSQTLIVSLPTITGAESKGLS
jgi:hypothetical protein